MMFLYKTNNVLYLTAECGAETKNPGEHQESELFWTNGGGQQESCKLRRCVSSKKLRRNSMVLITGITASINVTFCACWQVCVCTSGCALVLLPKTQCPEWKSQ